MEWLNYHHLLYFWMVAKEGTIARASKELRLSQPTISGQIRVLEEALDEKLFTKQGRHLVLTETGQVVYRYADEIFSLGKELMDTLRGRPTGRPLRLHVGIADVVPKRITHRLLEPAVRMDPPVQLVCREDKTDRLLAELAVHGLDLVLSDAPIRREGPDEGVQPSARRVRRDLFRRPGARQGASPRLPPLARGRSDAPAHRQHPAPALPRPLARVAPGAAARRRGVRGQRPARGVRAGGARRLRRSLGHRAGDRSGARRATHRAHRGREGELLRHHRRAPHRAPGGGRHQRGGARQALRVAS